MSDLDELIFVLESSLKRHGEKPLTNRWLLNIVRMAQRNRDKDYSFDELSIEDIY